MQAATATDAINTIRALSVDVVQKANSGHPGAPMGMAPMAHVLFGSHMRFNPKNPSWPNRDRFVLSNGHASALLYSMLHLTGSPFWTLDVLKSFRELNSPAAGHPENHFPGIEVTTGPLGQGFANAVGLAMAETHLAARFNREGFPLMDHYTYVFCGDGCLQEGISAEAASLAGHLGLGKLIVLYDDNHITIDGSTDLSFTEDVNKRFESYGWHTLTVENGNEDIAAIDAAIKAAKAVTDKPTLIKVTTIIGYGSGKAGTHGVHGSPLGDADIAAFKQKFGLNPEDKFHVPDSVRAVYDKTAEGAKREEDWNALVTAYTAKYPTEAAELKRRFEGTLPEGWDKDYPTFTPKDAAAATRITSGNVLNHFSKILPELFGGSADLNPSCFTYLKSDKDYLKGSFGERNVRFGVREHAMAAICNGLSAHGAVIPFCSTFLNFIGYAYGAVILSALSKERVLYVFTHDSIYLGQDGPTHQPVEKYSTCRATPNLNFWRPSDANETVATYISALRAKETPTVMSLSRQNVPNLEGSSVEKALLGGYVVHSCGCDKPDVILISTGSETSVCVDVAKSLKDKKVRVVSIPCWEVFDSQSIEYRKSVLPAGVPVLSVEAGSTLGWERYAHASIGLNEFGASGNEKALQKHFGFDVESVAAKTVKLIDFYAGKNVESRLDKPF